MPAYLTGMLSLLCLTADPMADAGPDGPILFEKHVRPILKTHCFQCHGEGDELAGNLDLRLRRLMAKGGDSGPAFAPNKADESVIVERLRAGEMPPEEAHLSKADVALIEQWISQGAKTARPEPEEVGTGMLITQEERDFWSFQPVKRPQVPKVDDVERVRTPIDAFILRKLEAKGLALAPEADKRTFIRRATIDLLGLPPSPEQVDDFVNDASPDAHARLIERLLASPHYGERWGRHWLDVVGYADSEGFTEADVERKWAYKYRDYVIRSLNADKPFDQFIREQLAGDEMIGRPLKELSDDAVEKLVATGFLRTAEDGTGENVDQPVARNQVVADTLQIVGSSLLGMTINCAQCHHHRYDPIPQSDYYRLRAVFEPALDWKNWQNPRQRLVSLYTDSDRAEAAKLEVEAKKIDAQRSKKQTEFIEQTFQKELAKVPEEIRDQVAAARNTPAKKRSAEQKKLLKEYPSVLVTAGSLYLYDRKAADKLKEMAAKAAAIRKRKPVEEFVRVLAEAPGNVPKTFLFARGDHQQPKQQLAPAQLTVLQQTSAEPIPENDPSLPTTGRRLEFAKRLTDGSHPLTARVLVNRFWMHHFGEGVVATPGDFGRLGARPTHPELLDWLADEFVRSGWSLKRLHRLIMNSSVYRQGPRQSRHADELDLDNRLLCGMPLRRLEAELIRDAVLAVSGRLVKKQFGAPIPVMADRVGQWVIGVENLNAGRPGKTVPMHGEDLRRSVYVQVRRSRPLGVMESFDLPRMAPNCEARSESTVATQSLLLMNNDFVVEQSGHFADRLLYEAPDDLPSQVRLGWTLAYSRPPNAQELDEAVAFVKQQIGYFKPSTSKSSDKKKSKKPPERTPEQKSLAVFCQTLLGSNEFLYVD